MADENRDENSSNRKSAVGLILGTGVGGAYFDGEKILEGCYGSACEFGHIQLYDSGHSCYCGNSGCAEQYLSGPALEAHYNSRKYSRVQKVVSAEEIFLLAASGDPQASACVVQYKKNLAKFLSIISNIFDPQLIILEEV